MDDQKDKSGQGPKLPYTKPSIEQIELRPEEAVLGNCKTAVSGGPVQATCNSPSSCSAIGS